MADTDPVKRGIYNVEYFSGAQVSLYIGDVWVDEVTTLSYQVMQNRRPIYGYASTLFDDVSEGQVLVQGQFTINFKEAGYLWLILDRYQRQFAGKDSLTEFDGPFKNSGTADRRNIEQIVNNEQSTFQRNRTLLNLAKRMAETGGGRNYTSLNDFLGNRVRFDTVGAGSKASLGGFASTQRALSRSDPEQRNRVGRAEGIFEAFEDVLWAADEKLDDALLTRRADDPRLNPFEIFVAFGDFAGDNDANHTIERLQEVNILGKSKQIVIDGMPIQEQYTFIARNSI